MTQVIRQLTETDAAAYRGIRLEALRLHPDAFSASFETESAQPLAFFAGRLADNAVFGGFADGALMGTAGFRAGSGLKQAHRATFWGMYVRAPARGLGLADALVLAVIAHARTRALQLHLTVVADNAGARKLYDRHGFEAYGVDPRALRVDGRFHDEVLMLKKLD